MRSAFAAAILFAAGSVSSANILVNGGFEDMPNWNNGIGGDGAYTLFVGSSIPGWTIESGHGATIHNAPNVYPTISGTYSLNTDGEGFNGHNVSIYQDFASDNGVSYDFSFDWQNWFTDQTPRLNVLIADVLTDAVLVNASYGIDAGTHHEAFNFVGTGNALRLIVRHSPESGYNDNTFIVDNFDVTAVPSASAASLFGAGLLASAARRRR